MGGVREGQRGGCEVALCARRRASGVHKAVLGVMRSLVKEGAARRQFFTFGMCAGRTLYLSSGIFLLAPMRLAAAPMMPCPLSQHLCVPPHTTQPAVAECCDGQVEDVGSRQEVRFGHSFLWQNRTRGAIFFEGDLHSWEIIKSAIRTRAYRQRWALWRRARRARRTG